jgi:hypothetical protein
METLTDNTGLIDSAFALWSSLGSVLANSWMTGLGLIVAGASAAYATAGERRLRSGTISVEGRSIDALNVANLRRRRNRSLVVRCADHTARIDGDDLTVTWQYDGFCRARRETSIEFSIDSENILPFGELDCRAYDLQADPELRHPIQPVLVENDGASKKIAVPFLKALVSREPFSVMLRCKLPGCMRAGVQYYTSTLSFDQRSVENFSVRLIFDGHHPDWLRVYECDRFHRPTLQGNLRREHDDAESCEFLDTVQNVPGKLTRIYVFRIGAEPAHRPWYGFGQRIDGE